MNRIRFEKQKLLRKELFYLEPTNSYETEIRKFQYLKDNEAITHEEFIDICNKLSESVKMNT